MDKTILHTDGKIYVKLGGRYIALINEHGDFNIKLKDFIKKIDSFDEIQSESLYYIDNKIYSFINGSLELLSNDPNLINAINNKVDKVDGKNLSTNDFTNNDKEKLQSIEEGAEMNVQPDWQESNRNEDSYILNKPTIPEVLSLTILEIDDLCNF